MNVGGITVLVAIRHQSEIIGGTSMFGSVRAGTLTAAISTLCLAAGGAGANAPAPLQAAPAQPQNTPAAREVATITGRVVDYHTNRPLSEFNVTVGALPNPSACLTGRTNIADSCGTPIAPRGAARTAADGPFRISAPAGNDLLVVGNDGSYATLHRSVNVSAALVELGAIRLKAVSRAHAAWLSDVNKARATISFPESYPDLSIDEYAQERADEYEMNLAQSGAAITDSGYVPYQNAYRSSPGAMYAAGGVLFEALGVASLTAQTADFYWMSEKANCPAGNWEICPFTEDTGHYINLSNRNDVWVGLGDGGIYKSPSNPRVYFNIMIIENTSGPAPSAVARRIP